MISSLRYLFLAVAVLLFPIGAQAAAPKAIVKLPAVIKKSGAYQLANNLTYSGAGNAIQIEADNVTIDLRGYTISFGGDDAITTEVSGIFAMDRRNITIRNGTITGFYRGVNIKATNLLFNLGGHTIEGVRADRCIVEGLHVEGRASVLRNNSVTTVRRFASGTFDTFGIYVSGPAAVIQANRISDVHVTSGNGSNAANGIFVVNAESCRVIGNSVANTTASLNVDSLGIVFGNCGYSIVADNHVSRCGAGLNVATSNSLIYRDNTVSGALVAYSNDGSATESTGNVKTQ